MLKENYLYIGEVILTEDGIIIQNGNEMKKFNHGDADGFMAYLAKCALNPPDQKDTSDDSSHIVWKNVF